MFLEKSDGIIDCCFNFGLFFYMKFKGGKGIAASAGMITSLAIYDWKFVVLGFFVFFSALILIPKNLGKFLGIFLWLFLTS